MILGPPAKRRNKFCPGYPHEIGGPYCGQLVHDGASMGPALETGATEDRREGSFPHGDYQYQCTNEEAHRAKEDLA